ncbi:hypothetical protein AAY473_008693, partial [Plecturocebus cupreus]
MVSDCDPTGKRPSSQKRPSPPRARAPRPVGGENWSFRGTVRLPCGCVPRWQDFQEIEPVPRALANNNSQESTWGFRAARDFSSSPAPGLLTLCSRLRAKPVFASRSFHRGKRTPPPPAFACESPSLAEGKPARSREEDGAADSDQELARSPGVWELE